MNIINLHGVRHKDVYGMLERKCINDEIPFIVITGKSNVMKRIVIQIIKNFGLEVHEELNNNGELRVCKGVEL